uniref:Uncharacterized protein n=1 Tax=Myotis myotis TaxID=51298 RepID=A0A7J7ZYF4_MYOMY|nr:hypothetical protein mMyoMyo1_010014 [Myotis myotis]
MACGLCSRPSHPPGKLGPGRTDPLPRSRGLGGGESGPDLVVRLALGSAPSCPTRTCDRPSVGSPELLGLTLNLLTRSPVPLPLARSDHPDGPDGCAPLGSEHSWRGGRALAVRLASAEMTRTLQDSLSLCLQMCLSRDTDRSPGETAVPITMPPIVCRQTNRLQRNVRRKQKLSSPAGCPPARRSPLLAQPCLQAALMHQTQSPAGVQTSAFPCESCFT